ncbi:hypothetical protein [Ralstonia phage RSP15]|uniref:hypothetical protein n=1 Tax=Ralstonia phage RSP15 TaxID=1785960 RepID=UPI00074D40F0|nr:hypothetical protein BH754_gp027 [Ralstonia phage RSP15]BAU39985.1 hypothetical protein [Ralstonia phage RSP15]
MILNEPVNFILNSGTTIFYTNSANNLLFGKLVGETLDRKSFILEDGFGELATVHKDEAYFKHICRVSK